MKNSKQTKLPKPDEIIASLRKKGFEDEIFVSNLWFHFDGVDEHAWFYYSKNKEDFDSSGINILVGETYDELEALEEATADGLASLIIQRYRQKEAANENPV